MKARVYVHLREGVLDPQGDTIAAALARLGASGVRSVRVGKVFEIELDEMSPAAARAALEAWAATLLASPVLEEHRVELDAESDRDPTPIDPDDELAK